MFESRHQNILPIRLFLRRMLVCVCFACGLVAAALGIGMVGYHYLAKLAWVDSLLNASMILTGMGPVDVLKSNAAKVFASVYALFSGLVFISLMALLFTPIAHRLLHRFHLSDEDLNNDEPARKR